MAEFDYRTVGYYFVTICTDRRKCVLGDVAGDTVILSDRGAIVRDIWLSLPTVCQGVSLDRFVIMPNHIHGILELSRETIPLPQVIGTFKSKSTKSVNRRLNIAGSALWQRSYHDHVIRDEAGLARMREYIANNPLK